MAVKRHTVGDNFRIFRAHPFHRSKFLVLSAHGTRLRNAQGSGLDFTPTRLEPAREGGALPLFVFLTPEGLVQADVGLRNFFEVLQGRASARLNPGGLNFGAARRKRRVEDDFLEVWDPNVTRQVPDYKISKYQGSHSDDAETYESIESVLGLLDTPPRSARDLGGRALVTSSVKMMLASEYQQREPEVLLEAQERIWPGHEPQIPGGEYFDVATVRNRISTFGPRPVHTLSSFWEALGSAGGAQRHAWMLQYRVVFCFFCRGAERAEAR